MAYVPYPPVGQHGTSRSPLGLWQLDGGLTDSSGNGYDVALGAGTARYTGLLPGSTHKGFYFDSSTTLIRSTRTAALDLLGAITVEFLLFLHTKITVDTELVTYGDSGETLNDNYLWSVRLIQSATGGAPCLDSFWEYSTGTNVSVSSTYPLPVGELMHIAMTRTVNGPNLDVRFYVNGTLTDTLTGNHVPEIGASPVQKVRIGGPTLAPYTMIGSVCVIGGTALTDTEVLEDAKLCMPWL
jgi:hypothetical protein